MQPYIELYIDNLTSENSKKTLAKTLSSIYSRLVTPAASNDISALDYQWHTLTVKQASSLRLKLIEEGKSASYINTCLTFLRQTLRWALITEHISTTLYEQIRSVMTSVSNNSKNAKTAASSDDEIDFDWLQGQLDTNAQLSEETFNAIPSDTVSKLIRSIGSSSNKSVRNRAIFMCMAYAGLRREEVAQLTLGDLVFSRVSATDSFIKVTGKGAKVRDVPMTVELHKALQQWAVLVLSTGNKKKSAPLFRKTNIVDKVLDSGLSNDGVYQIIRSTGEACGYPGLHPHTLRHYFATHLLLSGVDLFQVAKLMGHNKVETTRRYDQRGFGELQAAMAHF